LARSYTAEAERQRPLADRAWYRAAVSLLTLFFGLSAVLYAALFIICRGPSLAARDMFVVSMLETSALKPLPGIFLSKDEIMAITEANNVLEPEEAGDMNLIQVASRDNKPKEEIIIEELKGNRFKGKMMIVSDPSRVLLGVSHESFRKGLRGKTVEEIIKRYDGIGGVNAGGFADESGKGDGSQPTGIVISEGNLKCGALSSAYTVIGFDRENKLVVGKMTAGAALARGVRDAVSFGPILILNGKQMEIKGSGGGLNPRTAIGQRADGSVLILTIDGRMLNSLGANMSDLARIMTSYGAVNAANLDGGSSTVMYYQGSLINVCCSLYGPRHIPTAFVIR
jgi:exopolysaccharide biosynthesis protein